MQQVHNQRVPFVPNALNVKSVEKLLWEKIGTQDNSKNNKIRYCISVKCGKYIIADSNAM